MRGKKFISVIVMAVIIVLGVGSVGSTYATEDKTEWYSNANLNIRESPSTSARIVGKYSSEDKVNVLNYNKDGWSLTDQGYVKSDYLCTKDKLNSDLSDSFRLVKSEYSEKDFPLEYSDDTMSIIINRETRYRATMYSCHIILSGGKTFMTSYAKNGWKSHCKASDVDKDITSVLLFNGDFRDSNYGKDLGIIRNGSIINDISLTERTLGMTSTGDFVEVGNISCSDALSENIMSTFTFGPWLVKNGKAIKSDENVKHPRTFIGQVKRSDNKKEYWVIVADGRQIGYSYGLTNNEMSKLMVEKGCDVAYNLDGGGSSTLLFRGQLVNSPSQGIERDIADFVYLK